jgi:hypothetical protein
VENIGIDGLGAAPAAAIVATVADVDSLRAKDRIRRPIRAGSLRAPSIRLTSTRRISST